MKKQKKLRGLQRRKAISGYLFIMPFILGFSMFMVKPFFQSLYMSFCNVEVDSGGFKIFLQDYQIISERLLWIRNLIRCW